MNKQQPPLTLTTFAKAKLLPLEFLESAGLSDSPRGVLFPYGPGFRLRIRLSMDRPADGPDKRFAWADKRTSAEEVGCYTADVLLEHLRPKAHEPECYIVEGESDALTLWHAGMPAVGVPGAQMAGKLTSNHVAAFSSVVVWQEPGPGGEAFKTGVLARLTAVGYTDRVNVVAAKSDKDASALWLRVGGDRTTFMAELLRLPVAPVTPPAGQEPPLIPVPLEDFMEQNPELPAPVVHGLMREGETMNIIANTKVGKSWLAMDLALSVATGRPWLATFPTARGRVLVIDNELLPGVLARRPGLVAAARGIPPEEYKGMIDILSLRGRLRPLDRMADFFDALDPGAYKVIVLDAWYRFLPPDVSENGNGEVAQIYNTIDKYAGRIGASCVPIHHATMATSPTRKSPTWGPGPGRRAGPLTRT